MCLSSFISVAPSDSFTLGTIPPLISSHDGACHACHANIEMEKAKERSGRGTTARCYCSGHK